MRRIVVALLAMCLSAVPALAQTPTEKQKEVARGQTLFYLGLGVAATGLTPLFMGTSKGIAIGLPLVGGGSALAYYGHKKKSDAAKTSIGLVPMKKGLAFGVSRTW